MNVLITGGGGYVGTSLIPQLLAEGHEVTVYDNLMFGGNQLIPFFSNPKFKFVLGDVRDKSMLSESVKDKDLVIHLAAIVGYPACRKDPELTKSVNIEGTKNLISSLSSSQVVVFASTGSNYGSVEDICTEETPLNPLSLYGQTKTIGEEIIFKHPKSIVYRFATAFGLSPRLRLDLLINDFTYKCVSQGYLVVYEKEFKRTFIHVSDMGRAFLLATQKHEAMYGNAYNVGDNNLNYTKKEICDFISAKTSAYIHYADVGEDADKRNYEVSYEKINSLGFSIIKGVEDGIEELIKSFKVINTVSPYCNA